MLRIVWYQNKYDKDYMKRKDHYTADLAFEKGGNCNNVIFAMEVM